MRRVGIVLLLSAGLATFSVDGHAQEVGIASQDPQVAQVFALMCPGCGHLYSGETSKGATIATLSVGSVLAGMAVQMSRQPALDCAPAAGIQCAQQRTDFTPLLIGSAVGVAAYLYGLIDAGPSVRRMQRRDEARRVGVSPVLDWDPATGAQVGFRVSSAH